MENVYNAVSLSAELIHKWSTELIKRHAVYVPGVKFFVKYNFSVLLK